MSGALPVAAPVASTPALGAVIDPAFDWRGERRPQPRAHETIIYEAHVRGMTMLHPAVPENLRGTYAAMASEPVVAHLRALGAVAVRVTRESVALPWTDESAALGLALEDVARQRGQGGEILTARAG